MSLTPEMLREKRSQLVAACEQYAETATPDAVKAFDAAEEEIRGIDAQLENLSVRSRLDGMRNKGAQVVNRVAQSAGPNAIRSIADQMMKRDGSELTLDLRTLNIGTATAGGNTTVTQQTGEFVKWLDWDNPIRQLATTQMFPTNLDLPVINGRTSVVALNEGAAFTASDMTIAKRSFSAYKAAAFTDISDELLNDSVVDIAAQVIEDHARAHSKYRAEKHATGSGSGQEEGIFREAVWDSNNYVYTAGNSVVMEWTDVVKLYTKIRPGYVNNASWVMHPTTWGQLLEKRDGAGGTSGKFIYDGMTGNFVQDGVVGRIFGRPVYLTEFAPTFGGSTDKVVIWFGDMQKAYRIVDRTNATFRVNPYIASLNGNVRYESFMRSDAKIVDTYAGGCIVCGTV